MLRDFLYGGEPLRACSHKDRRRTKNGVSAQQNADFASLSLMAREGRENGAKRRNPRRPLGANSNLNSLFISTSNHSFGVILVKNCAKTMQIKPVLHSQDRLMLRLQMGPKGQGCTTAGSHSQLSLYLPVR